MKWILRQINTQEIDTQIDGYLGYRYLDGQILRTQILRQMDTQDIDTQIARQILRDIYTQEDTQIDRYTQDINTQDIDTQEPVY